jgi:hypothetical protein
MLDIKEAAVKGKLYISDLFKGEGARDFLLEEIDVSKDKQQFFITVSFLRTEKKPVKIESTTEASIGGFPTSALSPSVRALIELNKNNERRLFKTAVVDSISGNLIKIVRDQSDLAA